MSTQSQSKFWLPFVLVSGMTLAGPGNAKDCRDLLNAPAEQAQLIACTQAALKVVGYDPGKVDGVLNQRTQALISLFQDSERITQDGKPSVALLGRLLKTAPGPVQIADVLAGTSGAPAGDDLMTTIRRDQYLAELAEHIKNSQWREALPSIRKLDSLGIAKPEAYYYFKAKAFFETGDPAVAETEVLRYLRSAGTGGQYYKDALRLLSAVESAAAAERAAAAELAAAAKRKERQAGYVFKDCSVCPEIVSIPAGIFQMGSNGGESDEKPVHRVDVPAFAIGKTEVTQAQWRAIMGSNPSKFSGCDDCPVENVSWHDAQDYLNRLSSRTGQRYRLPSEAEWEYACRAGGRLIYCGGKLDRVAWYDANSGERTQPVARKQPNAWGLHDMTGNVDEWVQDCYNHSYNGAPTDGSAWSSGNCGSRVQRGGSWGVPPFYARAANRDAVLTEVRHDGVGFRPVRIISP